MRRLATLLCACSSPSAIPDAAHDGTPLDAAPRCDVTAPFSAPRLVDGVNTVESDIWGWQTADERTLYFSRYVAPYANGELHVATRSSRDETYAQIVPLDGVNTILNERRPILTGDGLTLLAEVTSDQADILIATRPTTDDSFSTMTAFANINDDPRQDFNPWISSDALVLYFTSDRSGNNSIHRTQRANRALDFDEPVLVAELDSSLGDYMGALSSDGLEIVFGSRRATSGSNGDLFHAVRATPDGAFESPQKLEELSDPIADEYATWLSDDRCELMFTSNRPGVGAYDIWFSTRY